MQTSLETIVLTEAVHARASDIHIDPLVEGYSVRMRIDGQLTLWKSINRETGLKMVNQIKADAGIEPGVVYHPVGERLRVRIDDADIDLRITLVPCISGPKLAIRLLDPRQVSKKLPSIGLADDQIHGLQRWLTELNGMILVTGPTACGKTTTLYALLHELVEDSRHVVTVEDPVEYEIDGINQIEVDEKHQLDFEEGVRTSLRLDPDCLMVGEIRERAVAMQAAAASIQGHVVMATMHSRDAVSAVTRLRNFGISDDQISAAVGVIVNQRLVRLLCPDCRSNRRPTDQESSFLASVGRGEIDSVPYSTGCDNCRGSGFKGRTGLFEVWNLDQADYEMILSGADEDSIRSRRRRANASGLVENSLSRIEKGLVSVREVMHLGLSLPWEND